MCNKKGTGNVAFLIQKKLDFIKMIKVYIKNT